APRRHAQAGALHRRPLPRPLAGPGRDDQGLAGARHTRSRLAPARAVATERHATDRSRAPCAASASAGRRSAPATGQRDPPRSWSRALDTQLPDAAPRLPHRRPDDLGQGRHPSLHLPLVAPRSVSRAMRLAAEPDSLRRSRVTRSDRATKKEGAHGGTMGSSVLLHAVFEALRLGQGLELLGGVVLDLTDSLAGDAEGLAYLLERARLTAGEPESQLDHLALA